MALELGVDGVGGVLRALESVPASLPDHRSHTTKETGLLLAV